jgi:hypothetical protein
LGSVLSVAWSAEKLTYAMNSALVRDTAGWTEVAADAVSPGQLAPSSAVSPERPFPSSPHVCPTLRISCEAVPPSIRPAGAQGGTSTCSTGAALSFVSCIRLFDRPGPTSRRPPA